jgi:hypothetical protein
MPENQVIRVNARRRPLSLTAMRRKGGARVRDCVFRPISPPLWKPVKLATIVEAETE